METIDWHAVKVLARKELQQMLQHRQLTGMFVVASLVIFVIFPLLAPILTALGFAPSNRPLAEGVRYTASIIQTMFFYMPPIISSAIATDSFAGEKDRKTIETTLLLPCSDRDLVIAKVIVSVVPQLLLIAGGFMSVGLISNLTLLNIGILIIFNDWTWYFVVLFVAPLYVTIFTLLGILGSILTRTVKGAQCFSSTPALLVLIYIMSTFGGESAATPMALLILAGIGVVACAILLAACIRSLDREKFILQTD